MPATKTTLLLCCLPASVLAATGESSAAVPAAADPRPMLLWYAALAVPVLVSLIVGILSIVEFFSRAADKRKAEGLGGFVTHTQLMSELDKVYDTVKRAVTDATASLVHDIHKLETGTNTNTADIAHVMGMIEGLPARPRRVTG
jgi:hypothetical protein